MEFQVGEVVSVHSESRVRLKVLGGPLHGRQLTELAQPMFPPGCNLPPAVEDRVLWLYLEQSPPAQPHYLALSGLGVEIVVNSDRHVVLKQGTLGVARLQDTVAVSTTMAAWIAQVGAAIAALDAGTPVTLPTAPTDFGYISSASEVVKAG